MSWDSWCDRDQIITLLHDLIGLHHVLEDRLMAITEDVANLTALSTAIQATVTSLGADVQSIITKLDVLPTGNLTAEQVTAVESSITIFQGVADALTTLDAAAKAALNPAPAPAPTPGP